MPTSRLPFKSDTDASTVTMDFSVAQNHTVTLGGNRTLAFSNPQDGELYTVQLKQDGTGSRTVTWPSTVVWAGGSAPTLTTTASYYDEVTFIYDGVAGKYRDVAVKLNYAS